MRRADVVPLECVARGYLSGTGWAQYRETGAVCGVDAAARACVESDRLPEPIFTPTTKAAEGHDLPVTPAEAIDQVGRGLYERLKELTLGIYERIARRPRSEASSSPTRSSSSASPAASCSSSTRSARPTRAGSGRPTPTSRVARSRASTSSTCATGSTRAGGTASRRRRRCRPTCVAGTAARYREAYERVTGRSFDDYRSEAGAQTDAARDAAALDRLRSELA